LEKKERKSEGTKRAHEFGTERERESLKVILRGIEQSIKCIGRSPRLD